MKIIKGNKSDTLTKNQLDEIVSKYNKVIVDLGTGDGRFVLKNALKNPNNLYIGIDPSEKQLQIYSKEANKKRLNNALFIVDSIQMLTSDLYNTADELFINLPWGTLLEQIVNPTKESILTIYNLLKEEGTLQIVLGYQDQLEPGETERLNLPELNYELIKDVIYPAFTAYTDFELVDYNKIDKDELKQINSSWAKKLMHGSDRPLYKIIFSK